MRSSLKKAILETIAYADIFDFPLTEDEIFHRLITSDNKQPSIRSGLKEMKRIREKDGYYYLNGRHTLVPLRKRRTEWSKKKMKTACRVAAVLCHIPTLKLIGVSGGLASGNADANDDIDFFFITAAERMWTSRLLVTGLLETIGFRRRPGDVNVKDKICANMMIDENHLEMPTEEQDLFGAYEVALMRPLWQRDDTYSRFLAENEWVRKWLPNRSAPSYSFQTKQTNSLPFLGVFEQMCKSMQLWYMNKRRTTEIIGEGAVRFHPHDARKRVMEEYRTKLRRLRVV